LTGGQRLLGKDVRYVDRGRCVVLGAAVPRETRPRGCRLLVRSSTTGAAGGGAVFYVKRTGVKGQWGPAGSGGGVLGKPAGWS
jgi:hypothetical protein